MDDNSGCRLSLGRSNTNAVSVDMGIEAVKNGLIVDEFGRKQWFVNDQLHRTDGPARIWPDGRQEWWVCGEDITLGAAAWMRSIHITWPWDDQTQILFLLTWDECIEPGIGISGNIQP